jgi:hypothetical protein
MSWGDAIYAQELVDLPWGIDMIPIPGGPWVIRKIHFNCRGGLSVQRMGVGDVIDLKQEP